VRRQPVLFLGTTGGCCRHLALTLGSLIERQAAEPSVDPAAVPGRPTAVTGPDTRWAMGPEYETVLRDRAGRRPVPERRRASSSAPRSPFLPDWLAKVGMPLARNYVSLDVRGRRRGPEVHARIRGVRFPGRATPGVRIFIRRDPSATGSDPRPFRRSSRLRHLVHQQDILFVIPALNEEGNLPAVIQELKAAWPEARLLVVVSDGVRGRHGAGGPRRAGRAGRGPAFPPWVTEGPSRPAIKYGLRSGMRVVVTFDADGQHDPADVGPLVQAVRERGRTLAIGSRRAGPRGSYRGGRRPPRRARALFGLLGPPCSRGCRSRTRPLASRPWAPRGQELFALSRTFPDRYPDADALGAGPSRPPS